MISSLIMESTQFEILPVDLLQAYCDSVNAEQLQAFDQLAESPLSDGSFSFYTSVSAVFSSKIEGEAIELDSYVKYKRFGVEFLPDYTRKTDDLYSAYQFAQSIALSRANIEQAHRIITAHILPQHKQGKVRNGNMYVTTPEGRIEYVAATTQNVKGEADKFYTDLIRLMQLELTLKEVFFFAALLHLVFVKVHPFDDGNGRTARLIEKWFLAEKIGKSAWLIQSEKMYYTQHSVYYKNIRLLGLEYDALDYSNALPFLLMLPEALV